MLNNQNSILAVGNQNKPLMKEKNKETYLLFIHDSKYVRIVPREEENFFNLLEQYGSIKNIPSKEVICVCKAGIKNGRIIDIEDYFFVSLNELADFNESPKERRRTGFLNSFF